MLILSRKTADTDWLMDGWLRFSLVDSPFASFSRHGQITIRENGDGFIGGEQISKDCSDIKKRNLVTFGLKVFLLFFPDLSFFFLFAFFSQFFLALFISVVRLSAHGLTSFLFRKGVDSHVSMQKTTQPKKVCVVFMTDLYFNRNW